MANGKATGPDELPAELLKLGLSGSSLEILLACHGIIVAVWMTGEIPQEWKDASIKILHDGKGRIECIDLAKVYDSVDRVLLWKVLARFGVPPRMIKVVRVFHDGMLARVQLDDGHFLAWFNIW